jgi:hypothetical protein
MNGLDRYCLCLCVCTLMYKTLLLTHIGATGQRERRESQFDHRRDGNGSAPGIDLLPQSESQHFQV